MSGITPIELLTRELNDHKKALKKSRMLCFTGKITWELHKTHYHNLMPQIKEYRKAIQILKRYS